ncbi:hypothetical protein I550_0629 [Mycobacterium intracellulare 1956]|uniref:Uncharacterized protein n=2 Tax=Mycobacterium intracellulare TaxID=1767 RepID=X8CN41_MYCIT|nr:hypothetical protein OCU_08190 [Mycobacterium intracellulare ATCC 13950]AFC52340.1 hypothetical protein OCQ_08270 [Mycobacterium paraintracellulare]ETZ38952.1 hypothetical protein L843_1018 [Mycobacterium intracellulare MIN_061107_1834]EUA25529.1 hypothetical protein I548_3615 [Mycobacterium intracellulare]EUA57504.1 hypothetical protein I550_0629 [Mycobacterium intracellulare 1956]
MQHARETAFGLRREGLGGNFWPFAPLVSTSISFLRLS